MEDIIFRYESFGILIYSKKYKAYFVPKNYTNEIKILDDIENKRDELGDEFFKELEELGYGKTKRELYSKNSTGLMSPLEYYFDFTNVCNLRCNHCYNRENMNTTTMEKEEIRHIIQDMYKSGAMRLHLAGGEPTLFPGELNTYLKTAKEYGIVTSMASNGVAINDEICQIITDNDIMSITISIESAFEEKNALIRGKGNLKKAIDGIKKLVEYKEKNKKNLLIGIKVSYDTDMSEEDFEELIKLAINLKINILKFANPERCLYHEQGYYSKVSKKYYDNIKIVSDLKKKYGSKIFITEISSPVNQCKNIGIPGMEGCIGAQELIAINSKGNITPCLMNDYNLGNVKEYSSISELYKSDRIKEYWNKIRSHNCQKCENYSKCRGGCQVRKIVEYGEIKGKDPLCPLKNNIKIKEIIKKEKPLFKNFEKINVLHSL